MVFILRLFSILTLLIIKIEFWYQKSLFNFYMRQISDRFYTIQQSQITSFSLVIHVVQDVPSQRVQRVTLKLKELQVLYMKSMSSQ